MGLPRPPGFAGIKSWVIRALNGRFGKVEAPSQPAPPMQAVARPFSTATSAFTRTLSTPLKPRTLNPTQVRGVHHFHIPRFNKPLNFPKVKLTPTSTFLRPQVGAFPRSAWGSQLGGAAKFHTSPASSAVALNQIAHSVSLALRNGLHTQPKFTYKPGQIVAQVAARAACQTTDGPAGYIRFTLSPPAWTPTDTDLSDPDLVKAIDTQIAELQRVKTALLKLKTYGDFPVRAVLPTNPEPTIDVLFRGASADEVARWNKNEFKLSSGRVGADQMFCAGRFEDNVKWSEVLDAERKVEREMGAARGDAGLLNFWEELNLMQGRIH
jgi:hypothetical protein